MVKSIKSKKNNDLKDNLVKEKPLINDKEEALKEKDVKEKDVKEKDFVKPKKVNKWVEEVKSLQKKEGISYKEAMKKASLIRNQGTGGKS